MNRGVRAVAPVRRHTCRKPWFPKVQGNLRLTGVSRALADTRNIPSGNVTVPANALVVRWCRCVSDASAGTLAEDADASLMHRSGACTVVKRAHASNTTEKIDIPNIRSGTDHGDRRSPLLCACSE